MADHVLQRLTEARKDHANDFKEHRHDLQNNKLPTLKLTPKIVQLKRTPFKLFI